MNSGLQPLQPLTIKGAEVGQVDAHKFLGLHMTENLSWAKNTEATVKKAQQRFYFIKSLQEFIKAADPQ